tara:strand:- start:189 stop:584 length:396 start_codon:yes stop_codon:yes gene_type:complete
MTIYGIGTDIVNIKRLEKSLKKNGNRFRDKIFSSNEINYCTSKKNPIPFYAKRFAAKEALTKALGLGFRKGLNFKNIEIVNNKYGKPLIRLKGKALIILKKRLKNKKYKIDISLSDDKPWAQATVIISLKK